MTEGHDRNKPLYIQQKTRDPPNELEKSCRTRHVHAEIWQWTLTQHAIAPCRVEDIYNLQECDNTKPGTDPDFYWLGYVPCRCVLIYGMVVGVQVYEQRVVYTVDDGTGKIDCNLRETHFQQPNAKGRLSPTKSSLSSVKMEKRDYIKGSSSAIMTIPAAPKPIAAVGDIVRATGRVLSRHNSRLINLDKLTICLNVTEEPNHWLRVLDLHETWYRAPATTPFVIPQPPAVAIASSSHNVPVVSKEEPVQEAKAMLPPLLPLSPSKLSVASSAPSTPSSVASSSVSSHHGPNSPPRLRHPSRLHTRDLTANTFRIYVKHYMDHAPSEASRRTALFPSQVSDSSEDEGHDGWGAAVPGTPTKPRQQNRYSDMTPKASKAGRVDETPKAHREKTSAPSRHPGDYNRGDIHGYTLSHLRRVPELALLARRVVEAEHKRRTKEQRKKQKEGSQCDTKSRATSKSHSSSSNSISHASNKTTAIHSTSIALGKGKEGEPISAKIKRLFRYAIRQLYQEGSIIMWDGPVRPLPRPYIPIPQPSFTSSFFTTPLQISVDASRLWKSDSSTATDNTVLTSLSSVSQATAHDDDYGNLSDPPAGEESYIPLTTPYLARVIEHAIQFIMSRPVRTSSRWQMPKGAPQAGPTVGEIVHHLHKKDERWAHVGEWAVKEALEWGREQGRVWCIGDGRWEICG